MQVTFSPLSSDSSLPGTVPFTSTQSRPGAHILSMDSIFPRTPPVTSSTSPTAETPLSTSSVTSGMSFAPGFALGLLS